MKINLSTLLPCVFLFLLITQNSFAQGIGINDDNSNPDASAMLDVKSTTKGILIPRMTTAQRTSILTPATGLLVFDSTTNSFWYFDGAVWTAFLSGTDNDNQDLSLAGNVLSLTNDGTTVNLSGFLDNTDNQTLTYAGNTLTISNGNSVVIPNGDITGVTAGDGLIGGGTTGNVTLNVVATNGLTDNANDVRLGGTLIQNTTITQGAFGMTYNLNGTGDFNIQDNGTTQFQVQDNGDVRADNTTFYVDASTNRVGVGTTAPGDKLHVVGDILLTGGVRNIEIQAGDQNIQLDDANPTWNGDNYGGVTRFLGDGTLAASKLEAGGLQLERRIQIRGGAPGLGKVLTSDAAGNATWETPTVGDITGVNAGDGLTGGGAAGTVTLNVVATNGLTDNANDIRLGGTLIQATTITQAANNMTYNLNGAGDFHIQDAGVNHFSVTDNGNTAFGGDVEWRDENTGGTLLAQLFDDGNDGRFIIRENGVTSVDLDANTQFIFNEQGLDRDFRIESDANGNMFRVDAGNNRVGIGTGTPDNALDVNGKLSITQSVNDEMVIINDDIWSHGSAANLDFGGGGDYLIVASRETGTESNGFFGDGNYSVIWNPGDNNRTVRFLDEDGFNDGNTNPFDNNAEEAYIDGVGAYVQASDRNRKENITKISGALNAITSVNGYTYNYKLHQEEIEKGDIQLTYGGVIAQEIEKVFPHAVQTDEFGGKFVHYDGLTGLFIEAIKEQQVIISDLKATQEATQKELEEIKALLREMKK